MSMKKFNWTKMNIYPAIVLVLLIVPTIVQCIQDYSDLPPGPYCAKRVGQCCPGRVDECSHPIAGTLCYCDDFCNRTRSEDCCPDFWTFCKGLPEPEPIKQCLHNGKYYLYKQTMKDNCNLCKCTNVGDRLEMLCEKDPCLVDPKLNEMVNRSRLGWTTNEYTKFWGRKLEEGLKLRLGTKSPNQYIRNMNPVRRIYDPNSLPKHFDSEENWPGKVTMIQDQGWCGASWAVSTAAVSSDRLAIMSKGKEQVQYSAQHLLSCNNVRQQGCDGGHIDRAWSFMSRFGVVSENCFPYEGTNKRCPYKRHGNLLSAGCKPLLPMRKRYYATGPAYRLGNETDIMDEILMSGPVQATMKVYHDFFGYKGGIYRHSREAESRRTGHHSVRIVGWGEDTSVYPPQKYWRVANSWGRDWGENGYFRIVRGTNECEIESYVIGVWAKTAITRMSKRENLINNTI